MYAIIKAYKHKGYKMQAQAQAQTEWAHLPNAKHIDWVLSSVKANPKKWDAASDTAWDAARGAARDAAWDAAYGVAWGAAWNAAWNAARGAAWNAAWVAARNAARNAAYYGASGAIIALIAYDDCGYMIESEIGELKIIAKLGDQKAILLLPACIVLNKLTKASIAV